MFTLFLDFSPYQHANPVWNPTQNEVPTTFSIPKKNKSEKKMLMEFTIEGRYEDFNSWLSKIEKSNVLIDVDSVRGVKNSPSSDTITFNIKMYTYALQID